MRQIVGVFFGEDEILLKLRFKGLNLESFFMAGYVKVLLKMHKKHTRFHRFLLIIPV